MECCVLLLIFCPIFLLAYLTNTYGKETFEEKQVPELMIQNLLPQRNF